MENTSPVFKPPVVKEYLTKGARFTKWDDDTAVTSPVTLKVDPKGYYLYWTHQNHDMEFLEFSSIRDTRSGKYAKLPKDMEFLEFSSIRDTRSGKYAKLPKDMEFLEFSSIRDTRSGKYAKLPKLPKVRNVFNMDFPESHHLTKTLTIVSGPDMVNLTFHNFFASKENVSKDWADDILTIAYNPLTSNACRQTYLDKIYVRITLKTNKDGKIPVKNSVKAKPYMTKEDLTKFINEKQRDSRLNEALFPPLKPDQVKSLIENSVKAKPYMTKEDLTKFINEKQRDSRLNEALFPPLKPDQVKSLIEKYEPAASNKHRSHISPEGLLFYLSGSENYVVDPEKVILHQDMMQPIPHYYIKSSHNTYLTAGQFSGISSPEMYRQCLLAGCRCLELDCWKGKPPEDEPIITHGFTMTTEILFKDVIEAIAECAFKTSQYPVILSFENHVDCAKQQEKMAEYCRTIFGDALLTDPLENYPGTAGQEVKAVEAMSSLVNYIQPNKFISFENAKNFPMQLNMAMFEYNGRTGWLLKHDFLRRSDKTFDPYSDRIDSIVANTVSIKASISPQIYSGQFLSDKNAKTGVEVEVIGLPGDPKCKYKTKWSAAHNSINPVWNEEPFVFEKILMPEMAYLRICVHEEHGKFIGHRIIPVHALRSGFHHICLRSESNMPLDLPALFVYIEVKDYIPASFADFTDLLSNPTKEDKKGVKLAPVQKPPAETSNNNPPETPSTPGNKLDTAVPDPPADSSAAPDVAAAPTPTPIPAPRAAPRAAAPAALPEATTAAPPEATIATLPEATTAAPPEATIATLPEATTAAPPEATIATLPEATTAAPPEATIATLPEATTAAPPEATTAAPPEAAPAATPAETPAETPAATPAVTPAAPQEPPKPSPEPTTATTEELKQHKNFVKISQKHEKQIKDLEKKYQKKGDDLVKKYSKMFAALQNQLKKKAGSLKKGDTPDSAPAPDPKVAELKEKLKTELTQLREEQYDLIKKKKEEHSAEQSVKLLETAKEKHASELKALKESVDRIKKELNTTFIQEVVQMTTAIREHIVDQQEKLEKKQAATLDEIKEKTDKHKQDVNTEFDEKMKALPKDVEEGVNSAVRPYFPDEVEKPKENGSQVEGLSNEVYTG
ncbi:UNVERIFIED_CONTAM: hypothetical protein FKN15_013602 [Acipenser sinensis]